MMRKLTLLALVVLAASLVLADEDNNEESLKCIVKYLEEKGIREDFFSSVNKQFKAGTDCEVLINAKLTKSYGKIEDKLKADTFFSKYSTCIMNGIKTEENKGITLQREAIKIHGLGVKVWNYFNQKEHLDELKKKIENSINKVANEKCITVY